MPRVTISGGDSRWPVWRSTTTIGYHDPLGREVPAVADHEVLDLRRAAAVEQHAAGGARAPPCARPAAERQSTSPSSASSTRSAGEAGRGGEPRVLRQHAVLAVHRDEVARPHAPEQLHEVVLAAVAGDVHSRGAGVHHVAAEAEEVADQAGDRRARCRGWPGRRARRCRRARRRARGARRCRSSTAPRAARPGCRRRRRPRDGRRPPDSAPAGERARSPGAAAGRGRWPPRRCRPSAGRGTPPGGGRAARGRPRAGCGGSRWRSRRRARARACGPAPPRRRGARRPRRRSSPGCSTFVLSESSARTPRSPQPRRAPRGRCAPRAARVASILKSPLASTTPGRRLDREGEAVEHAVGHADRVDAEGPDLDRLARREHAQVGADAALAQALAREAEGQRGCRRPAPARPGARRRARRCGPRGRG